LDFKPLKGFQNFSALGIKFDNNFLVCSPLITPLFEEMAVGHRLIWARTQKYPGNKRQIVVLLKLDPGKDFGGIWLMVRGGFPRKT